MSTIFVDCGISLDGYFAGDNRGPDNPLGDNGTVIHQWIYQQQVFREDLGLEGGETGTDNKILKDTFDRTGAYIMGKRMFEEGERHWPEDLYKANVYVLTHEKREPWIQKGSTKFYFVNDGIDSALKKARISAKQKDIRILGGAYTIQEYLNASLVDELNIHIAPVLLGSGIRLLDNINPNLYTLEIKEVIPSLGVTHIYYTLKK